jgi:hypothetical protein
MGRPSKQTQIAMRREKVFELSAMGLTQMEIASKLFVSQKTVSADIKAIKLSALDRIRERERFLAHEFDLIWHNFCLVRKYTWQSIEKTDDVEVKDRLYHTIITVNEHIGELLATGDIIIRNAKLFIKETEEDAKRAKEQLQQLQQLQLEQQEQEQQQQKPVNSRDVEGCGPLSPM